MTRAQDDVALTKSNLLFGTPEYMAPEQLRRAHVLDARDYHALSRCLGEIKADCIVQLAAIAHANRSNKDPYSTFDHSFRTLENALDSARDQNVHFVYFSSSMVYGNFEGEAAVEERDLFGAATLSRWGRSRKPPATNASSSRNEVASSAVQPKTLPPRASGETAMSVPGIVRTGPR